MPKKKSAKKYRIRKNDYRLLYEQYSSLTQRQATHNALLWQVPIMFFTAQAFLFMIALGTTSNYPWWSRLIAAFVSFIFSILSDILFENHRIMELTDAEQLYDIELFLIKQCSKTGQIIHSKQIERSRINGDIVWDQSFRKTHFSKVNNISSYSIWKYGFRLTASVSIFICIYNFAICFPSISCFIYSISPNIKAIILLILSLFAFLIFMWRVKCAARK